MVDWAMRYGNPSIASRLGALQQAGCDRILIVPLYPQYAAATTATVADKAFDALKTMRWQPAVRIAPPWHDDPVYIEAVAASLEAELARLSFKPEMILASFHGVPKDYLLKGDPYHCQCQKTARLLRARLGLDESRFMLTFQSRFGTAEWLQPYTDMTVQGAGRARREEPRDRHAGLCGGLPGNAGRDRGRKRRDFPPPRRQRISPRFPA